MLSCKYPPKNPKFHNSVSIKPADLDPKHPETADHTTPITTRLKHAADHTMPIWAQKTQKSPPYHANLDFPNLTSTPEPRPTRIAHRERDVMRESGRCRERKEMRNREETRERERVSYMNKKVLFCFRMVLQCNSKGRIAL